MLVNTKVTIEITNNGEINSTSITLNEMILVRDALLTLRLAEKAITDSMKAYFLKNPDCDIDEVWELLKMNEL